MSSRQFFKVRSQLADMADVTVDWVDEYQLLHLDQMLIVVYENDKVIGTDTKRNCHHNENIEKGFSRRHRVYDKISS